MDKPSSALKDKIIRAVKKNFPVYLTGILEHSAAHGMFGMNFLDSVYAQLPSTDCDNCGRCCNSISILSLEYHKIIRTMMKSLPPDQLRLMLMNTMRFDLRSYKLKGESRLKCAFRNEEMKLCAIYPVRPIACRLFGLQKTGLKSECKNVRITEGEIPSQSMMELLQTPILKSSESFEVIPGRGEIAFFPIEFWIFKAALGFKIACEIYREILIPLSTPLMKFWNSVNSAGPRAAPPGM